MMLRLTVWMSLIAQWGWSQVAFTDPAIVSWGDSVQIIRGYQDLADSSLGLAGYGVVSDALGEADPLVRLGEPTLEREGSWAKARSTRSSLSAYDRSNSIV